MEPWIEWGYAVLQGIQALHHPLLTVLFKALTFMGDEEFYLLLIPFLYWVVNKRLATRFTLLFLFSAYLNQLLKGLAAQPRPDPARVTVLDDPGGGGLPSGHSQNALVLWGFLAVQRPIPWFRWAMIALIGGISFSRLYLGVHFPHDVLAGWLVGLGLLFLYFAIEPRLSRWLPTQALAVQMGVGAGVALLLTLLYPEETALRVMATLFGMALAIPLERAYVAFEVRPQGIAQLLGRLLLGFLVLLLLWRGIKPLLLPLGTLGDFLRYALLGFWVGGAAPWLFVRLGLARREGESP